MSDYKSEIRDPKSKIFDGYPLSPPTGLQSARIMHFAEQASLAKASGFIRSKQTPEEPLNKGVA
jgi:hypothetical protein